MGIRVGVGRPRTPSWQRLYLDLVLLAGSAAAFLQMNRSGYQVVLAPEGVLQSSVSYQAFLAPLLLWLGGSLLAMRLWDRLLTRRRNLLGLLARPLAGQLAAAIGASIHRQRLLIVRGMTLVALAVGFATSTAVFNATYEDQARVDAELTTGADVTVTGPAAADIGQLTPLLAALPGVLAAQPMQHRFAYVGADLQDLYGIDPRRITSATTLSNAYFANGDAGATLAALAAQPDGVLVSAETASDYLLQPGDTLNLRLQSAIDQQYHIVPFRFVGVVREFPTAPKDSFLIANASYIADQTATSAAGIVLLRAAGDPTAVAEHARGAAAALAGATVSDVGTTRRALGSSLSSIDLHALTRMELAFALLLVVAAAGLVQLLGVVERERSFAILAGLGARPRQLAAFQLSESVLVLVGGSLVGLMLGLGIAKLLVLLLSGVFDPPPESLSIPSGYVVAIIGGAAAAMMPALGAALATRRPIINVLRDM
jgi:putative ABC transport system permease protein